MAQKIDELPRFRSEIESRLATCKGLQSQLQDEVDYDQYEKFDEEIDALKAYLDRTPFN